MAPGKKWEKLDNAANLFPVIASEDMTNTYRISAVLYEEIQKSLLQKALDMVLPRFPGFNVRLRTGFFWYYLEENGKPAPHVTEEEEYPCRYIFPNRNNSYLFRVTYYRTRINLEVFHVLADGMGSITFLRELVYQYLRLSHRTLRERLGDGLSEGTSLNREDSFRQHYKKGNPNPYPSRRAFLIKGEKLPYRGFGVIHGYIPLMQLRRLVKEVYHISINEYLIAVFVWGIYQAYPSKIRRDRPVRIAVPVNLRPFFGSNTTKNFFAMVSAEFFPTKEAHTFADVAAAVHESLQGQMTRENLETIFSYNVKNAEALIARAVPLQIKNIAMRIVYTRAALANTSTITNIGNIQVKEDYRTYIRSFFCFLSFSKGQNIKATAASYGDTLTYTIVSAYTGTQIQKGIFSQIAADGIDVTLETNGVYYE